MESVKRAENAGYSAVILSIDDPLPVYQINRRAKRRYFFFSIIILSLEFLLETFIVLSCLWMQLNEHITVSMGFKIIILIYFQFASFQSWWFTCDWWQCDLGWHYFVYQVCKKKGITLYQVTKKRNHVILLIFSSFYMFHWWWKGHPPGGAFATYTPSPCNTNAPFPLLALTTPPTNTSQHHVHTVGPVGSDGPDRLNTFWDPHMTLDTHAKFGLD